jgi:YfiH family protein
VTGQDEGPGIGWWPVDLGPGVIAGVTTRAGGLSSGPYESLDLALHVGDDPAAVHGNRHRLAGILGLTVVYANQVHGTQVVVVDRAMGGPDESADVGDADGLVTTRAGVGLAVMVADCLPVLLADGERGVVGAAHAGRRGIADGVLPAAVAALTAMGARPDRIRCFLGPAICAACYEVGADVAQEVARRVPAAPGTSRWGTPALDLVGAARDQLAQAGVRQVETSGICTVEDPRFYSYRRDGTTGRFAGVIAIGGDTP